MGIRIGWRGRHLFINKGNRKWWYWIKVSSGLFFVGSIISFGATDALYGPRWAGLGLPGCGPHVPCWTSAYFWHWEERIRMMFLGVQSLRTGNVQRRSAARWSIPICFRPSWRRWVAKDLDRGSIGYGQLFQPPSCSSAPPCYRCRRQSGAGRQSSH